MIAGRVLVYPYAGVLIYCSFMNSAILLLLLLLLPVLELLPAAPAPSGQAVC